MKHFRILFIVLILAGIFNSCTKQVTQKVSFAFYNVENLFDTIDDPLISDERYLPDSKIPWNAERYQHKLDNLTKVMSVIDSTGFPSLFGLCEVENIHVLQDLIDHPGIKDANYSILHKDSPDERGIDVALLYKPDVYTPISTSYINLTFPFNPDNKTRDILYSKGVVANRDTLHVFINHWTSRWGGQAETEPSRRFTGALLKKISDSILLAQPDANIIIAGDLNDNPDNLSIAEDLTALAIVEPVNREKLYNLSQKQFLEGKGTLYYKSWDMFDQIIVSGNMLNKQGVMVDNFDQKIIKYDWMLYQPKEGPKRPSRTAAGAYYGGYSDHLPVFIHMTVY